MSLLDDAAAAFRSEDDREQVDQAHDEQKHQARAQSVDSKAAEAEAEEMSPQAAVELVTAAWEIADIGIVKALGPAYELTATDKARLIPVSARMAQKHLPADFSIANIGDLIPLELVFIAVCAFVYVPKHNAVQEQKAREAKEKEVNEPPARPLNAVA